MNTNNPTTGAVVEHPLADILRWLETRKRHVIPSQHVDSVKKAIIARARKKAHIADNFPTREKLIERQRMITDSCRALVGAFLIATLIILIGVTGKEGTLIAATGAVAGSMVMVALLALRRYFAYSQTDIARVPSWDKVGALGFEEYLTRDVLGEDYSRLCEQHRLTPKAFPVPWIERHSGKVLVEITCVNYPAVWVAWNFDQERYLR